MLNGLVLSKYFWTKAVIVACYTQNRSIIVKRYDKTPYEIFREIILDISYFHVFGCPVFIHNHKDHLGKFDAKADNGYFLGYSFISKAFRVFNTKRQQVEETYHVTFDESMEAIRQYQVDSDVSYYIIPHGCSLIELTQENHVPEVIALNEPEIPHTEDTKGPPGNNTKVLGSITESLVPDVTQSHITNQASTSSHPVPQDRWSREQHIKLVNIIGDPNEGMLTRSMAANLIAASASECLFADFLSEIEPIKVYEALKHPGWIDAMQEELNQFYKNKVWTLVPLPYEKISIGSKWVFRNKKDEHGTTIKNKARLVAQGYSQEEGFDYDETFVPVARMEANRIFFAFSIYMKFKVYQMDVKSAFLNGKLKEEVYVKHPSGFESSEFPDYVCFDLKRYSDSDYVGCNMDRKSTTCACQILSVKLVCWSAKKQQSVVMSSAEAEYVVAAGCCASILWMKSQLSDYDIYYKMVPIFCDNTSAIAISNNPVLHSRTKHIDIRYHFIRDHILKGDIELHFIPTEYQLADIFTKPLDEPTFTILKAKLGMLNID
ncbi:retrovirus-related pol polyprotein from transposon TNT 1-94 [Tanacetum coccineum]